MSDDPKTSAAEARPGGFTPVSLSYLPREFRVYSLNESELETISSLGNSMALAFLGITAGAFITLLITVLTVSIPDWKVFSAFICATILSGVLSLFFAIRAFMSYREAQKKLNEIKRGTAPGA